MGQHEYDVSLAKASTSKDMAFVAKAFNAGVDKERQRALKVIRNGLVSGKTIDIIISEIEEGETSA